MIGNISNYDNYNGYEPLQRLGTITLNYLFVLYSYEDQYINENDSIT